MNETTVWIRARVVHQREQTLTLRLEDGYGNAEVVAHKGAVYPEPKTA